MFSRMPKDHASKRYKDGFNAILERSRSQREKFKAAAHEVEASDSEEAFNEALRKVGTAKPSKDEKLGD